MVNWVRLNSLIWPHSRFFSSWFYFRRKFVFFFCLLSFQTGFQTWLQIPSAEKWYLVDFLSCWMSFEKKLLKSLQHMSIHVPYCTCRCSTLSCPIKIYLVSITCGRIRPGRQHRCDPGCQMHRCKHTPEDIISSLSPQKMPCMPGAQWFLSCVKHVRKSFAHLGHSKAGETPLTSCIGPRHTQRCQGWPFVQPVVLWH